MEKLTICIAIAAIIFAYRKNIFKVITKWTIHDASLDKNQVAIKYNVSVPKIVYITEYDNTEYDNSFDDNDWYDYFMKADYEYACELIDELIPNLSEVSEKIFHESMKGFMISFFDYESAENYFGDLISRYTNSNQVYEFYAEMYIRLGNKKKVIEIFEQGVEKSDEKMEIIFSYADYHAQVKEFDLAINILMTKLDPNLRSSEYYNRLAQLFKMNEQMNNMFDVYLTAYKKGALEHIHTYNFANELSSNMKYAEAIYVLKKLIQSGYCEAEVYCALGNQYLFLELNDLALEAYKTSIKKEENNSSSVANIGNLYMSKGLYSKAIEYFEKSIKIDSINEYNVNRLKVAIESKNKEREREGEILWIASKHFE